MSTPTELIERLAAAWGDPEGIASLMTEDAEWWISPTSGLPSPMKGRDQILETMQRVFGEIYDASRTRADVHVTIGDDHAASMRITMHSHVLLVDRPYENEYAIFIRTSESGEKIERVWEYVDIKAAMDQMTGGGESSAS